MAFHAALVNYDLGNVIAAWQIKHDVSHYVFDDRTQSTRPCISLDCQLSHCPQGPIRKLQLTAIQADQFLILLDQSILWLR